MDAPEDEAEPPDLSPPKPKAASPAKANGHANGHTAQPMKLTVHVTLRETEDEAADLERLQEVLATLKEFPGSDPFHLSIASGGEVETLELPGATVRYCESLLQRMTELLGQDAVRVQQVS